MTARAPQSLPIDFDVTEYRKQYEEYDKQLSQAILAQGSASLGYAYTYDSEAAFKETADTFVSLCLRLVSFAQSAAQHPAEGVSTKDDTRDPHDVQASLYSAHAQDIRYAQEPRDALEPYDPEDVGTHSGWDDDVEHEAEFVVVEGTQTYSFLS